MFGSNNMTIKIPELLKSLKLITKRKNFTKKELKKEYLKDAGVL